MVHVIVEYVYVESVIVNQNHNKLFLLKNFLQLMKKISMHQELHKNL